MKYTSTRGGGDGAVSFEDAICSGYAPDGGLFVPETLPRITKETLTKWANLSYPELTFEILRMFISRAEVPDQVLQDVCTSTLQGFEDPNQAVPIVNVGGMCVAELFHGPTFCFKDFGLGAVVSLLSYFASKRSISTTLLVATTGDTGPAAVHAVSSMANPLLTIAVHYPQDQISEFQKRQLTTVDSPCVRIIEFQGGGDDMDPKIKRILQQSNTCNGNNENENENEKRRRVVGVNSYNIGRPLMQMVHFVWTYLRVVEDLGVEPGDPDTTVDIVLPTGAMGNIVGGYMAKKMGVPLGKLCAGTNVNDIVFRVVQTGEFHKSNEMKRTLSEAINIQLPYNFERLLYYLTDCNHILVKEWMETVDATSQLDLNDAWLSKLQQEFGAARVTDDAMCETICRVRKEYGYTVDPHTAVAISAAHQLGYYTCKNDVSTESQPVAILSTACPCKFQESMTIALGTEGWKIYVDEEFPKRATKILGLNQVEPIVYEKDKDWEQMTRDMVDNLAPRINEP